MQDLGKAAEVDAWIESVVSTRQVIAMAAACFREYSRLLYARSVTLREDAMIAATARVRGLTIATRQERDCKSFSVPLFNPFRT